MLITIGAYLKGFSHANEQFLNPTVCTGMESADHGAHTRTDGP